MLTNKSSFFTWFLIVIVPLFCCTMVFSCPQSANPSPTDSLKNDSSLPLLAAYIAIPKDTSFAAKSFDYPYIVIKNINIKGNKVTKRPIILREMTFHSGDTVRLEELEKTFKQNRNNIYNTRLFNDVSLKIEQLKENIADIIVNVEERWYIFPAPIFEIADRNFNEWWNTHNRDLKRTQYGMFLGIDNFRGRKERVKLLAQFGYTQKFDVSYSIPYIDKKRQIGLNPFVSFSNNREIYYTTQDNKQVFFSDNEKMMRSRFKAGINLTYRPNIHESHNGSITYFYNTIADTVAKINPDYFLNGQTTQQYVQFFYSFTDDHRDIAAYPRSGYFLRAQVAQLGVPAIFSDISITSLYASYTRYIPLGKRWFGIANARGKLSFPAIQPYFNQQGGMGYGSSSLRGYEYSVIDGQMFGLLRTAMRYELLNKKFKNNIIKARQFRTIPLAIYLKTYAETGYVRDAYYYETNPLTNVLLGSTGLGIDVLSVYDWLCSLEYSVNLQGQHGFFISFSLNYD